MNRPNNEERQRILGRPVDEMAKIRFGEGNQSSDRLLSSQCVMTSHQKTAASRTDSKVSIPQDHAQDISVNPLEYTFANSSESLESRERNSQHIRLMKERRPLCVGEEKREGRKLEKQTKDNFP